MKFRGNLLPFSNLNMREEYSITIRWHALPKLPGVINYKPIRISDSFWQHITASNNLYAFTAIVVKLMVFFWVYMPRDRSFITFRRNVLSLLRQNLVQADAELAGKEWMCPSAHILHCRALQGFLNHSHWLLLTLSFCLLPQLWPVRGSPKYTIQVSHSFLLNLHSIYLNHIHTFEDWASTFFQNT